MAKQYEMTFLRRLGNRIISTLLMVGLPPGSTYLLATQGRMTGQIHTTPVQLVEDEDGRYLVAPYGSVNWVHNVQANPRIQLRRGRKVEHLEAVQVETAEAGPVLKRYVSEAPIVKDYFDAPPDADVSEFEKEAGKHPVFRLIEPDQDTPDSSSTS